MYLLTDISQLITLEGAYKKDGRKILEEDLSIINNGAIAYSEDKILWVGKTSEIPNSYTNFKQKSLKNKILLPGFSDCHTHTVYSGSRAAEYAQRLSGADYQQIAASGGGILSTVTATRNESEDELFNLAATRIKKMVSRGITSLEIKSGYGLTAESELKILKVIGLLKRHFSKQLRIFSTFMGAHAVPSDFKSSADFMQKEVLPLLEDSYLKFYDAVDIFHEKGYFSDDDAKQLFNLAKTKGKAIRMHADEFNDNQGAALAMEYKALSCDHLMKINSNNLLKLGKSKTVAVALPGTSLFLGKDWAPIRELIDANAKVAIASDFNPGSCHYSDLVMIAKMVAPKFKINIGQLITSITLNPSHSLGFMDEGVLQEGKRPSFSIFNVKSINDFVYDWAPTEELYLASSSTIFE